MSCLQMETGKTSSSYYETQDTNLLPDRHRLRHNTTTSVDVSTPENIAIANASKMSDTNRLKRP
jgi:hypothetical protein